MPESYNIYDWGLKISSIFLRLGLNHIPGIECLSVIIVVIIRRGMGCHQATLAASSRLPRLTFTEVKGRLIYTLVTLHPNFHILAIVLCASQNDCRVLRNLQSVPVLTTINKPGSN